MVKKNNCQKRTGGGESVKITLPPIRHDRRGFETLVLLHAQTENCFLNDNIEIDMTETTWFDADMCAAFGAILYNLGAKLNTVRLTNIPHKVQNILSRNGFSQSLWTK